MLIADLFHGHLTMKELGKELGVVPNTARKYVARWESQCTKASSIFGSC